MLKNKYIYLDETFDETPVNQTWTIETIIGGLKFELRNDIESEKDAFLLAVALGSASSNPNQKFIVRRKS